MKKILLTLMVVITAAVLIGPKLIGETVQHEREKVLVELNKAKGISLVTQEYIPGWFGAQVNSTLTVNLEEEGFSEITLQLNEALSFGPIIITNQGWHLGLGYSDISFNLATDDVDNDVIKLINDKVHLSALMDLSKDITTFINTDEFSYAEQGSTFKSLPAHAVFSLRDNKKVNGKFHWGGLDLNDFGERFIIGKVDMTTRQEVVSGDYFKGTAILSGDAHFSIEKINLYNQDEPVFSLNNTELSSVASVDNDLFSLAIDYHSKDITAAGQYFEKPTLALTLSKLDVIALQELNNSMMDLSSGSATGDNSEEMLKVLSVVAEKLLAKDPMLTIKNLSVIAPEGEIATALNLSLNKQLFDVNNLNTMSFIAALEADATGKVPMPLLTKYGVSPMVDGLVQQGFLTKKDNVVSFSAKYMQSQLTLNNKPFQF